MPISHQGCSTKTEVVLNKQVCGPFETNLWSYIKDGPNYATKYICILRVENVGIQLNIQVFQWLEGRTDITAG